MEACYERRTVCNSSHSTYEPQIRVVTEGLLADLVGAQSAELVAGFTAKLPIYVIASLLGLPHERWEWLRVASREIGDLLEPFNGFDPVSMDHTFAELHEYFSEVVAERRVEPQNDLISALASASDGDVLDTDEVIAMIGLLLFAGHATVTGLLGNSIVALARFPDQRGWLRANPDQIDNAVEELLRFDSPAPSSGRVTVQDITVGGITIPKGSTVGLIFGAANRDRRHWPDADQLRLDRVDPKPISFGHGIHHCLGAALARLEAKVALPAFLAAFGDYTVDLSRVTWEQSLTLRGPTSLQVHRGTTS